MGYMNGVVDFSGPAIDYGAEMEVGIANDTIDKLYQAIHNQEITINNLEQAHARKDVAALAFRDTARILKNTKKITPAIRQKFTEKLQEYNAYVEKYGYKAFRQKADEATARERQIREQGEDGDLITVFPY